MLETAFILIWRGWKDITEVSVLTRLMTRCTQPGKPGSGKMVQFFQPQRWEPCQIDLSWNQPIQLMFFLEKELLFTLQTGTRLIENK